MPVRDLLNAASGAGGPTDPYFYDVSLLLNGDGTNGAQNNTFLDSSTNNFTITRNGNTTQGSFSPYGSLWSNYFGTSNYFTVANNSAILFGSSNWTVEFWINPSSISGQQFLFCLGYGYSNNYRSLIIYNNSGDLRMAQSPDGSTNYDVSLGLPTLPANVWTHIAVVRNGSTVTPYFNGIAGTPQTAQNLYATPQPLYINNQDGQSSWLSGYLSNYRVVKGTAVYTSNFTPPTTPLTTITNTSLLICNSNRFVDTSGNNLSFTVNGSPSVQRFSPFNPTATYDPAVIGGSGYFDGSSNLSFSSSVYNFGSSTDYSVEFFIYFNSQSTNMGLTGGYASGTFTFNYQSGVLGIGKHFVGNQITASYAFTNGQWYHVVGCRQSGTLSLFVNGTRVATTSDTTSYNATTGYIGYDGYFNQINGYMSNVRVLSGASAYNPSSTTLTVPTAPLTAISGTQLLTNMTNAGIPDLAMQNNLQTIGSAQVSTSVKKYGTGSLKFDGSVAYLNSNPPSTAIYTFGTGDFTIEYWLNITNYQGSNSIIFGMRPANTNGAYPSMYFNSSGVIYYYVNGSDAVTGSTLSTGTWYHIAVCRSATSTKMFINGTQSGSTFSDSTNYGCGAQRPIIGGSDYYTGSQANLVGYIDDFRITKGYARYTSNFTAPTAALPTY